MRQNTLSEIIVAIHNIQQGWLQVVIHEGDLVTLQRYTKDFGDAIVILSEIRYLSSPHWINIVHVLIPIP